MYGVDHPHGITYLIRKVVRVKHDFHGARLANEGLWLLGLAAEHSWLPLIGDLRFGIPVHDLQTKDSGREDYYMVQHEFLHMQTNTINGIC